MDGLYERRSSGHLGQHVQRRGVERRAVDRLSQGSREIAQFSPPT